VEAVTDGVGPLQVRRCCAVSFAPSRSTTLRTPRAARPTSTSSRTPTPSRRSGTSPGENEPWQDHRYGQTGLAVLGERHGSFHEGDAGLQWVEDEHYLLEAFRLGDRRVAAREGARIQSVFSVAAAVP
jgi:hypothetical protein